MLFTTKHRSRRRSTSLENCFHIERLEPRLLNAYSPVVLNSWFLSGQAEYAQVISGYNVAAGPTSTWPTYVPQGTTYNGGNSTPLVGDVQKVSYSDNYVYVNVPDLASYVMGPWFNNGQVFQNWPSNMNETVRIALGAYPSSTHTNTNLGAVGVAVNGVSIFNNQDAFSYNHASGGDFPTNGAGTKGDGIWNRDAEYGEKGTFDEGNGHQPPSGEYHYHVDPTALRSQLNDNIDYVGTTNYFPYDPMSYLNHGQGADGTYIEHSTNLHHSPLIGWTFDGHPIYGPYGYSDPTNANSAIKRMVSSYSLRNITTRTSIPGWAAQATFGANVTPDGTYALSATQYGPNVSTTYPLGRYGEDYAYVPGAGDLDQYNGRWTVTPEFPNGVYAYFVTINTDGSPAYPYILGRQYYGTINSGKVTTTTGDGTVHVYFDVSTNTAPVVSGPATASVAVSATLNFTGANLISVSDIDAAASESVTLSVTSGTLSVDLSGALAGGASITAGANGSSTFTLTGGISQLNAALATLGYSAPASGTSATLSVQANDGSATNHLSNLLTTNISLITPPALVSAVSRMSQGSAGTYEVQLPLDGTGVECRTLSNGLTIVLSFDQTITGGSASVTSGTATAGTVMIANNTMTVPLATVSDAQPLTVTCMMVTTAAGGILSSASASFRVLTGDVNASGAVSSGDITVVKNAIALGPTVNGANFRCDVNASGTISSGDITVIKNFAGTNVNPGVLTSNTPPAISAIADQNDVSGTASSPVNFTIGDSESDASTLAVSGLSSDQTIVPDYGIILGGSGTSRTISIQPLSGLSGTSSVIITLTVSDGLATLSTSFNVTVTGGPTASGSSTSAALFSALPVLSNNSSTSAASGSQDSQSSGEWTAISLLLDKMYRASRQ